MISLDNWSNLKKVVCGVAAVLGTATTLLGFTWAMDRHWTTREVHELFAQSVYKQFETMSRSSQIEDARRDVQYWLKMEMFWRVECEKNHHPGNQQQLQHAIKERMAAEERQRKLQGK